MSVRITRSRCLARNQDRHGTAHDWIIVAAWLLLLITGWTVFASNGLAQSAAKKQQPTAPASTELSSEDLLRNIACLEERLRALEEEKSASSPRSTPSDTAQQKPCAPTTDKPWITATTAEHLSLKIDPP